VTLAPVVPEHVAATIDVLRAAGCEIAVAEHRGEDPGGRGADLEKIFGGGGAGGGATRAALTLTPPRGGAPLAAFDVATAPHPGPPTDMQPQFCVLAAVAAGTSTIRETVFEKRFSHVRELAKMGCDATREGEVITVRGAGGVPLRAADVRGSDLRASAALVLAGLASDGATRVEGLKHLDRGYERLDEKLRALGADVDRREKL
jgi:UDP-N-acetylglucosamine 1-carboxyvinyltransferase